MATQENPVLAANERARQRDKVQLPARAEGAIRTAEEMNRQYSEEINEQLVQTRILGEELIANTRKQAAADQVIVAQTNAAKMEQQNATREAYRSMDASNNLKAIYSEINRIQDEIVQDTQHLDRVMDTDITGVGIIDNKLREIKTRKLRDNLDRNQQALVQMSNAAAVTSKAIDEAHSIAGKVAEHVTEATKNAELQKVVLAAERQIGLDRISINQSVSQQLGRLQSSSAAGVTLVLQEQQLIQSLMQTDNAEARAEIARRQLAGIKDEQLREQAWIDTVKKNRAARGQALISDDNLKQLYADYTSNPKKVPQDVLDNWYMGLTDQIARTTEEVVDLAVNNGVMPNQYLAPVLQEAATATPIKGQSKEQAVAAKMDKLLTGYEKVIKDNDTNNPFIAGGNEVAAQNEKIVQHPAWQKVVQTRGVDIKNHSQTLSTLFDALQEGEINAQEFDEFVTLTYGHARAVNNALVQPNSIGRSNPVGYKALVKFQNPTSTGFPTSFLQGVQRTAGQFLSSAEVYDLTSMTDAARIRVKFQTLRTVEAFGE